MLERACAVLRPEGRPLYSGLLSQAIPPSPLGRAWRYADMLREFRGDSHTAAWISAGLNATEIGLLSDLYFGLPMRSYSRSRAWSTEQFDAAEAALRARGLLSGDGFSDAGRAVRESVEDNTDLQMDPAITAIGADLAQLCSVLNEWSGAIRAAGGYLNGGPDSLTKAAR